ncbi:hypothetical protein DSO57_1032135 [Entomophthora muscae]|uniref:Uncharacterized protein n=1 Tax=Entomophthora muscae TaxID=34485 RepID=A0ACC2RRI9_9FUNG|nr:hypothetical protein DSO57_1032135 [Entomophthora muscae]
MTLKAKAPPLMINEFKEYYASSSCSLAAALVEEESDGPLMSLAALAHFFPEIEVLDCSELVYSTCSLPPAASEEAGANILDCFFIGLDALEVAPAQEPGLLVNTPVCN